METAISPSLPSPGVITVFEPSYARYLQSEYAELSKFDVSARSLSPFLCTEALFFFFTCIFLCLVHTVSFGKRQKIFSLVGLNGEVGMFFFSF